MGSIDTRRGERGASSGRGGVWLVFLLALALRLVSYHELMTPEGVRVWDSDAAYHLRRCRLTLASWPRVPGFEPLFDAPHGAPIPWPPVFDFLLASAAMPWTGADPPPATLEATLAPLPPLFSAAAVFPAAAAARALTAALAGGGAGTIAAIAPAPAAIAAALGVALFPASIAYGRAGLVDHHGFAATLEAWIVALWILAGIEAGRAADRSRRSWRSAGRVAMAGIAAAVALGTWVASLTVVLAVELGLLGAWLLAPPAEARRLARLAVVFHGVAAAVTLPLALASPWWQVEPWSMVNLSRFHPTYLALMALASAWLGAPGEGGIGSRLTRAVPRIGAVGLAAWLAIPGLRTSIHEALSWAGRENVFMAGVQESRRLVSLAGPRGLEIRPLLEDVGWAGFVLPLAVIPLLWIRRRGDGGTARRPAPAARCLTAAWFLVTGLMAFSQRRFAASWATPAAVVTASVAAWWMLRRRVAGRRSPAGEDPLASPPAHRLRRALPALLVGACFVSSLVHAGPELGRLARALRGDPSPTSRERWGPARALREALEVVRSRLDPSEAVLSSWDHGHWIEYAAERPTVATNFGLYVGEDGFRDSARFLLAEDPGEARAILRAHHARAVLTTSHAVNGILAELRILGRSPRDLFHFEGARMIPRPAFHRTLLARLHLDDAAGGAPGREAGARPSRGSPGSPREPPVRGGIPWLRLVHESSARGLAVGSPQALVKVFEVVAGASLDGSTRPEGPVAAAASVRLASGRTLRVLYTSRAGPDGTFALRVPYPTEGPEPFAPGGYVVFRGREKGWTNVPVPAEAVARGGRIDLGEGIAARPR